MIINCVFILQEKKMIQKTENKFIKKFENLLYFYEFFHNFYSFILITHQISILTHILNYNEYPSTISKFILTCLNKKSFNNNYKKYLVVVLSSTPKTKQFLM